MLSIEYYVIDTNGRRKIHQVRAVRGEPHAKLPSHFYYSYEAKIGSSSFTGEVLHNYDNGAIALGHKISKDIMAQQKAAKDAAK